MLDIFFWVFIGALIGWHFPKPPWATWFIAKLEALINKVINLFRDPPPPPVVAEPEPEVKAKTTRVRKPSVKK